MDNQIDILEEFLKRLITSPAHDSVLFGLANLFERVIDDKQCLPNLDIPYDDITSFIYNFDQDISLEDLNLMMEELEGRIQQNYPANISTGKKHDKHHCFSKFRTHIYLAVTQKNHISHLAKEAKKVAQDADHVAKEAKKQAEKAKSTYDGMMVNYITILGIFASIIITIFGGMQIISATTGLLQANLSLATLILVLSFLTILIILILAILLNWISNLKESKNSNKFIYWALFFTLASMLSAGVYMFCYKNTNPAKLNSKVLIKDESKNAK